MNLSALTDPNPKNYLDINCHNINCNEIQANNLTFTDLDITNLNCVNLSINDNYTLPTDTPINGQALTCSGGTPKWRDTFNGFQAQLVGPNVLLAPTINTRNICNFLTLGTNYNVLTFTYTCPVYGEYEFHYTINWQWTSTVNPASGQLDSSFVFNDDGEIFFGYVQGETFAAAGTTQTFKGINTVTVYRQLQAGSTVQISVANNSTANNVEIMTGNTLFGGRLLQEL